jgi:hypothetical protein
MGDGGSALEALGSGESITFPFHFDLSNLQTLLNTLDGTDGLYTYVRVTASAPGAATPTVTGVERVRVHVPPPDQLPPPLAKLFKNLQLPVNPPNKNPELARILVVPDSDVDSGVPGLPDGGPRFAAPGDFAFPPDGGAGTMLPPFELPEGEALVVSAGQRLSLRAIFVEGSAETYNVVEQFPPDSLKPMCTDVMKSSMGDKYDLFQCPITEAINVRWFTTAGIISRPTTGVDFPDTTISFADDPMTKLNAHLPPSGSLIDVYAVAHDERAGTAWLHRRLLFK